MSPQPDQPIHWDRHKANLNITFIMGLVVAAVGLLNVEYIFVFVGLAVAAYSWLTNAKQYYIYRDALIIVYGRPRVKVIPFARVSHVELLTLPTGNRLRVQLVDGRPVVLAARDSETFQAQLDTALEEFRSAHPEEERGNSPDQGQPPY